MLKKCCFLLSASESYQNASVDLATFTGVKVGHSSQHRLVQRQEFSSPQSKLAIAQLSIDGGKVDSEQSRDWRVSGATIVPLLSLQGDQNKR
ncbi:MAG TPA: hypothetical protein VK211_01730 [Kamptonema sp.]|nr:hypothetical protein [Kamptonema sp.]